MRKQSKKWILLLTTCAVLTGCAGQASPVIQNDSVISPVSSAQLGVRDTESIPSSEDTASSEAPALPESTVEPVQTDAGSAAQPKPEEAKFKVWTDRDLVYPKSYNVTLDGVPSDIAEQNHIDADALIKAIGDFAYERNIRLSTVEFVREQRTNLDSNISDAYILRLNGDPQMDVTVLYYQPTGQYILFMNEFFPEVTPTPSTTPSADNPIAATKAPESFEIRNVPQDAVNLLSDTEAFRNSLYSFLVKSAIKTDAVEIIEDSFSQTAGRYSMLGACQYGQVIMIYIDPATGQTTYAIN